MICTATREELDVASFWYAAHPRLRVLVEDIAGLPVVLVDVFHRVQVAVCVG